MDIPLYYFIIMVVPLTTATTPYP